MLCYNPLFQYSAVSDGICYLYDGAYLSETILHLYLSGYLDIQVVYCTFMSFVQPFA